MRIKKTITLGAVGDISLSHDGGEQIRQHGFGWPFERMVPHFRKADVLFGNMESVTLPPDYPAAEIDPAGLVSAYDATPALREAGFDIMTLANNHILDGGSVSMFHTRAIIEKLGIATVGVGRTQREARRMRVLERGGIRLGFLAYGEDSNYTLGTRGPCHAYYTVENVLEDVAANRPLVDVLVVSIHADLEFMETPSVPRRDAARRIARAGASIVLEHHPHVPQGVEMVNGCLIAYSLGNCFFPAHTSQYMKDHGPHTAHSFLLLAEVSRRGVRSFERIPFEIRVPPEERPVPLTGRAAAKAISYLDRLDRMLKDDQAVRRNWRQISLAHLKMYLAGIGNGRYSREQVMEDLLFRLSLVQENRLWFEEAWQAQKEKWDAMMKPVNSFHRPNRRTVIRWSREKKNT